MSRHDTTLILLKGCVSMLMKPKTVNRVVLIPLDSIQPNPDQPRHIFEPEKINELAVSIAQYGLLQPITVQQTERNTYQLVAGERRLLACKQLKMQEIPAIVVSMKKEDSAALALIENIQRCSLNYFEEAMAIEKLMKMMGMTQQQIANRLGKTQSTVANKLRLLKYPEQIRRKLMDSDLTERHARALLPLLEHEKLEQTMEQVMAKEMTVSQTEQLVAQLLSEKKPRRPLELYIVKDLRVFMDTVSQATELMKMAGIRATTNMKEDGDELVYTIRIKKKNMI